MNQIPNKFLKTGRKYDFDFEKDIIDLFLGLKSAHLSHHIFSYSSHLWDDFFNSPNDYYVIDDEVDLIRENACKIRKVCEGVKNIVDLGPGGKAAVVKKTFPFIRLFPLSLKTYSAVDISRENLDSARDVINDHFQGFESFYHNINFLDDYHLDLRGQSIALLFGLTLTNMPGIIDKDSGVEFLKKEMRQFKKLLPKESYFICSFDTCQDSAKMMKAYRHPKHAKFMESIVFKIKNARKIF